MAVSCVERNCHNFFLPTRNMQIREPATVLATCNKFGFGVTQVLHHQ